MACFTLDSNAVSKLRACNANSDSNFLIAVIFKIVHQSDTCANILYGFILRNWKVLIEQQLCHRFFIYSVYKEDVISTLLAAFLTYYERRHTCEDLSLEGWIIVKYNFCNVSKLLNNDPLKEWLGRGLYSFAHFMPSLSGLRATYSCQSYRLTNNGMFRHLWPMDTFLDFFKFETAHCLWDFIVKMLRLGGQQYKLWSS
jgi:hypothetical protein